MIVRTFDGLQALMTPQPTWSSSSSGSLSLYDRNQAYAEIYRTQPNVRICVDFLARNIAQLAPHVFRRVSDTDRVRLADHDLASWLGKPNPSTRRYRLVENLIGDLGIYFEAYWLKVRYRDGDGRPAIGLVALPPEEMAVKGGLLPQEFVWTPNGREKPFAPSEIVYFNGYNPTNRLRGLSPLETLRRVLAEEAAAGEHREGYWRNSARIEGVVTRPKEAKRYTKEQAQDWREQWQAVYAGGAGAGRTVLLQDGETFTPTSWSAKDSEFTAGGKLRREVCAAAYMIPQPMVGILDHATFSNIKEQHKHLYQDTLGPWLEMLQQEIEGQLLIECEDQEDVYVEFNIAAKLAGTPEEQIDALVRATGKPIMKVNEARARVNLPRDDDPASDTIAAQQGGPAGATATPSGAPTGNTATPPPAADDASADNALVTPIIEATRARQHARLEKFDPGARSSEFFADIDRWNRELTDDLTPIVGAELAARLALQANVATFTALEAVEATS